MPELSHASAVTVLVACLVAAAIAFVVGVAVTALIRRLAAAVVSGWSGAPSGGRRLPCCSWCSPFAGFSWPRAHSASGCHRAGYILGLVAIAIVGWLLTVVAVGVERRCGPLSGRRDEDRRSRHVRTKIILVTRVAQALIAAITVGAILWTIPPLAILAQAFSHRPV